MMIFYQAALIPDYPHLRGCTCKLRKCLRKCCPVGTGLVGKNCEVANDLPEFAPNIYYHRNADLRHHKWDRRWFAVVSGNTCNNGSRFMLEPDQHMSDINYLYLVSFIFKYTEIRRRIKYYIFNLLEYVEKNLIIELVGNTSFHS